MALVTKDINVAYESTSQEILEKARAFGCGVNTSFGDISTNGTFLSISGKGALVYCAVAVEVTKNKSATVTVKVDDTVIASVVHTNTSTQYDYSLYFHMQNITEEKQSSSGDAPWFLYPYSDTQTIGVFRFGAENSGMLMKTCNFSEQTYEMSSDDQAGVVFPFFLTVPFENSLEISVEGDFNTSNTYYSCGYVLE